MMRVGIIGAGRVARHHAAAVAALGHTVVAGATARADSPNWAAFAEVAPAARHAGDAEQLLDDAAVDALVVCLPWNVIPANYARLLRSQKPMLIEKPVALSGAQAAAALEQPDIVPANKLVGYNRRYYAVVERLRAHIAEGGMKAAHVVISEDVTRQVRRFGAEIVAGLVAFSSHIPDLMLHLFGRLDVVRLYRHRDGQGFVSVNGLLETAAGLPVSLALNASDPSPVGIRCLFDDGTTWHLSPLEQLAVYDGYDMQEAEAGRQIRRFVPHAADIYDEPADFKPGFLAQMRVFLSGSFGDGATPAECLLLHHFIDRLQPAA